MEPRDPILHRLGELGAKVGSRPPRSRPVRIALQLGIGLLIFGFLVFTVASQWGELRDKGVEFDLIWVLPALAVLPFFYMLGGLGWDLILRFLGYRLPFARAQVAFGQPLLARYVPGSVLYLFGRLVLSERAGVPRRITLASIVYEQAISVAAGVAVASYFVISHPDLQGQPLRWAVLAVVPAAIVILSPRVFGPLSRRVLAAFGREPLPATMPLRGILAMLCFYAFNWCIAGVGVYFAARSVHYIPFSKLPEVGSAQAVGFVAAVLSLVAPAGLGIRDAAFAWAVKVALPSGSFAVGAVIAIAVRAVFTVVELLYVGTVTLAGRRFERAALKRDPVDQLEGAEGEDEPAQRPVPREGGQRQHPDRIPGQKPG
jgi:glycosyltransferase 2 family protein